MKQETRSGAIAIRRSKTDGADGFTAILSTAHGHGSGAETVLCELIAGWDQQGSAIRLVSPRRSRPADAADRAGVPLIALATERDAIVQNAVGLLRATPKLRTAATVHAWHSRAFELALAVGRMLGVPATGSVHDHPDCGTHSARRQSLVRAAARRLDGLVFVSDAVATAWEPICNSVRRVTVHNGLVDCEARRTSPGGKVRVGFLGMNAAWKGFDVVANWASRDFGPRVEWRFYGDLHPAVSARAARVGAFSTGRSLFLGRKPASEIFDEIDVLVHASTEFDPFPTVLLEAARAGIPVIASTLGGAAEIVDHGTTGYLFDPGAPDAGLAMLSELVGSPTTRESFGRAARLRYERKFPIESMTGGYAAFWAGVRQ